MVQVSFANFTKFPLLFPRSVKKLTACFLGTPTYSSSFLCLYCLYPDQFWIRSQKSGSGSILEGSPSRSDPWVHSYQPVLVCFVFSAGLLPSSAIGVEEIPNFSCYYQIALLHFSVNTCWLSFLFCLQIHQRLYCFPLLSPTLTVGPIDFGGFYVFWG